jgi:hypothetical protein
MKKKNILIISVIIPLLVFATPLAIQAATSSGTVSCQKAGGTGLTAYMVVSKSGTTVHGQTINANGCDIGIYIAPGTSGVTITGTTISGANDHAIFAQDSWNLLVENNLAYNTGANGGHSCNVVTKGPCVAEDKAIQFAGVSDSIIKGNSVRENGADGGIGIATDGPTIDAGALMPSATKAFWSKDNIIDSNAITYNLLGCGIVISTYNPKVGDLNTWITDNTIIGVSPYMFTGNEYVGQIVVATDAPYGIIEKTYVMQNHIDGSLLPGIVVHSNAFGDKLAWIWIEHNVISENGWYPKSFATGSNDPQAAQGAVGIAMIAEHNVQPPHEPNPILSNAYAINNTMLSDNIAVWRCFLTNSQIQGVNGDSNYTVVSCPGG